MITYNAAISACGKGQQWQQALELFDEMVQKGWEPNMITYSVTISACGKGEQWQRSLGFFDEMVQSGWTPNDHVQCRHQRLRQGQAARNGVGITERYAAQGPRA